MHFVALWRKSSESSIINTRSCRAWDPQNSAILQISTLKFVISLQFGLIIFYKIFYIGTHCTRGVAKILDLEGPIMGSDHPGALPQIVCYLLPMLNQQDAGKLVALFSSCVEANFIKSQKPTMHCRLAPWPLTCPRFRSQEFHFRYLDKWWDMMLDSYRLRNQPPAFDWHYEPWPWMTLNLLSSRSLKFDIKYFENGDRYEYGSIEVE